MAVALSLSLHASAPPSAALDDWWPQWRGPRSNGASPFGRPPLEWSETRNVRWKVALPGAGHASPIALADRVVVLAASPVGEPQPPVHDNAPGVHDSIPVTHRHAYMVLCYGREKGELKWKRVVREVFPHEGGHVTGSPVSNSPVTDGALIYACFGSRGLYALSLEGEIRWQKDLGRMATHHSHGEGSSPVLHENTLILNWDHDGASAIYAFNKRTGEMLWKTPREEKTSWSTPLIVNSNGTRQVVVSATKRIRSYDVETGKLLWECAGLTDNVVSSPIQYGNLLVSGNSYYQQAMLAIRLEGAKGDLSNTDHVAWRLNRLTPYVSSPVLVEDTLYFLRHNQNVLVRLDPATGRFRGEPLRLEGIRDFIFASPVSAAGRVYVTGRDGTTVVVSAGDSGRILAVNRLDDSFSATAAIAGRDIFLRGEQNLYGLREP